MIYPEKKDLLDEMNTNHLDPKLLLNAFDFVVQQFYDGNYDEDRLAAHEVLTDILHAYNDQVEHRAADMLEYPNAITTTIWDDGTLEVKWKDKKLIMPWYVEMSPDDWRRLGASTMAYTYGVDFTFLPACVLPNGDYVHIPLNVEGKVQ